MFMSISNEPIKVDLQKLANQLANAEWCTGDRASVIARKTLIV